jgi:hypothetical protein
MWLPTGGYFHIAPVRARADQPLKGAKAIAPKALRILKVQDLE